MSRKANTHLENSYLTGCLSVSEMEAKPSLSDFEEEQGGQVGGDDWQVTWHTLVILDLSEDTS